MAKMNTSHRYVYDAAPATLFRARTAAAVAADGNSNEVVLDQLEGYWNSEGELADETLAVVINVTDIALAGNQTAALSVIPTNGAGTALAGVTLGALPISAPGQYIVLVDAATVKLADGDFAGLRIATDLAGTTLGTITFHAWMSQIKKA